MTELSQQDFEKFKSLTLIKIYRKEHEQIDREIEEYKAKYGKKWFKRYAKDVSKLSKKSHEKAKKEGRVKEWKIDKCQHLHKDAPINSKCEVCKNG